MDSVVLSLPIQLSVPLQSHSAQSSQPATIQPVMAKAASTTHPPSEADSAVEPPPEAAKSFASKFDELLELIKVQNGLISEQSKTLKNHSVMLQALEKDATKDDRAHEGRAMDDEQTWGALDKEALRKIRVRVEEWRDVMNISLIFIALFLTVVTTFISPIISLFTSPTDDSSKNPLPPVSTQFVALFYYLALMVSVFNSVLCVLGMQWAARLIATPLGNTNLERTLARERRAAVAEGYMLSLMGILVWTLLLSIGFFVLGFLIQLWEIAVSFTGRAPILLFGGAFATGLSVIIMGIIVVTTFHAALHNNSPFESPLSNLLQPFLRWSRYILPQEFGSDEKDNNDVDLEKKGQNDNEDQGEYPDEWEGGQNTPETDAVEDVEALVRWQKSDPEDVQALKAYARLVINATDMEVLERAVPSFEFGEWHKAGMSLSPIFMAVRDRFLATDTSFRLKETVNQQLVYFKDWKGWCNQYGSWRDDIRADDFTRWCKAQCKGLIEESRGSRRDLFPAFAFFTSLEDANRDLRGYQSTAETDDACIARILTTYNSTGEIGLRGDLFETAVIACDTLLQDGKVDEVTAILSDVEHYYVIQSFIRNPSTWWFRVSDLVSFMTKGKEVEILEEMCTFFSELPEMTVISGDDSDPLLICQFLEQLSKDLPKDFIAPLSFDLSPVIAILDKEKLFKRYANTLIYYLTRGAMEGLSDHHLTSGFWQHCRDVCLDETRSDDDLDSYLRNDSYFRADRDAKRAQVAGFYQDYHGCFIPLPLVGLSDEECDDLCNNICTSIRTAHDLTERQADDEINDDQERTYLVKDCKRPILELLDLEQDQRANVLTRILSNIQRSELLRFLLQDTRLDWERIKDLVSDITSGHEIGLLADISTSRHFRYFGTHANVRVFLSLLAHFIPLLPSDFTVSPDFDITRVLFTMNGTQFRLYQRERQHWSKDVATIIFYLDHGAFDAISDRYLFMAGEFFKLCQTDSPRMVDWTDDERISEDVQSRVAFYEKAFETRNAARWAHHSAPSPQSTETVASIEAIIPRRMSFHDKVAQVFSPKRWPAILRRKPDRGQGGSAAGEVIEDDIELGTRTGAAESTT